MLVHLLRGPYFERSSSRRLWHALVTNEAVIRSRLSELYLDLFLDEEAGIAFCRRPNLGELDVPTLLPRVRLRFLDSTLIVELRERLMRAQETGERVHVTRQDLREILRLYDAAALSNEALLERHLSGIVDRLVKRRILLTLKSGDDAFEISPVLPLLFTTSDIEALRAGYAEKAARDAERLGGLTRTAIEAVSCPGFAGCSGRFRRRPSPPRPVTQEGPDAAMHPVTVLSGSRLGEGEQR